jgi:diguanylate cyclase (GGDEF)-like protein/PAS domain S-box-containing protein
MDRLSAISRAPEFSAGLLEAAPDAIVVVDQDGTIVLVNSQAERMFGYGREELIGATIETLVPERFRLQHVGDRSRYASAPSTRPMGSALDLIGRRKDESEFPVEISLSPLTLGGERVTISIVRDVTERKQFEWKLWFVSTHDVLTGFYNRLYFEDQLARLKRGRQFPVSVMVVDLDGLKEINDTRGHAAGDEMLRRAAVVLTSSFRAEDLMARIGGDEFAILLPATDAAEAAEAVIRVRTTLEAHNAATPQPPLRVSVGAATARKNESLPEVLRRADRLMYEDKLSHRQRVP